MYPRGSFLFLLQAIKISVTTPVYEYRRGEGGGRREKRKWKCLARGINMGGGEEHNYQLHTYEPYEYCILFSNDACSAVSFRSWKSHEALAHGRVCGRNPRRSVLPKYIICVCVQMSYTLHCSAVWWRTRHTRIDIYQRKTHYSDTTAEPAQPVLNAELNDGTCTIPTETCRFPHTRWTY